jgi:hypothetical protein
MVRGFTFCVYPRFTVPDCVSFDSSWQNQVVFAFWQVLEISGMFLNHPFDH